MNGVLQATAADGTRIHCVVEGPADAPVVLLSHSLGVNLNTWDSLVAVLNNDHRVIRYDARGHGNSQAPAGEYSVELLARDALAVLDAAGVAAAHIVGLSMGGMVGMWIGAHAPNRLRRLVLANTTTRIPLRDMWNSRIETARTEGMASIAPATLNRWLAEPFRTTRPEEAARMIATMQAMSPVGYAGCCAALREVDLREDVSRITAPTLVITGALDLATTPEVAQGLAASIPGARCAVIAAAGHLSNVEQPEAFGRLVREFLAAP